LSTPFQNRLVGTIIVTAAIVIFLPGILDGEKKSYQSDFDNIPETPTFTGKVAANKFPESLKPKAEKKQFSKDIAQDDKLSADIVSVQPQPVEKIQAADEMALNKNNVPKEKVFDLNSRIAKGSTDVWGVLKGKLEEAVDAGLLK